jgi:hypothetical protein
MSAPIRNLDTAIVNVEFAPEIVAEVKVWVVRERGFEDDEPADETASGQVNTEVGENDGPEIGEAS